MKYIIILLTSLFLVSNASAEDKFKSIKDVCSDYEWKIITTKQLLDERGVENRIDKEQEFESYLIYYSKLYHYLDCREELGR